MEDISRGRDRSRPYAKKSLGQNFLIDQNVIRRIVDAIDPRPGDRILEIGPGRGAITGEIIERKPDRYQALEKDTDLARELAEKWPEAEVFETDALKYDWADLNGKLLKIAGNLPYNIGSRLIWDIVSLADYERAVFMVQHEVALRLAAEPGNRQYGALGAWVGNFARVEYLFKVSPNVFRPRPKVDSAVVRIIPRSKEDRPHDPDGLAALIRMCFQRRRKQIKTILKKQWTYDVANWFENNGISPTIRPEDLGPDGFRQLSLVVDLDVL